MLNKNKILESLREPEDRLFMAHVLDRAERAAREYRPAATDFMDPRRKSIAEKCLEGKIDIEYSFYGGYAGAEREMIIFAPDFIYNYDFSSDGDGELVDADYSSHLKVLNIYNKSIKRLTHRDYLGALLGLGIKREKIGDIVIGSEFCSVAVVSDIAEYILYNFSKVGNSKVEVGFSETGVIEEEPGNERQINANVASLRLDCVAGAGFGISRSKAAELIKAQKLNLNWEMVNNLSKQLKEGDVISIRGKGRIVLEKEGNTTKKNRINIILKKFS